MQSNPADYGGRSTGAEGSYAGAEDTGVSGWAIGFIFFAAFMMMLIGGFHIITGLIAIFDDDFYAVGRNYLFKFDASTWGWIHFVSGIIVLFAGVGLFSGSVWARIVAVIATTLSAFIAFAFIPYYPVFAILIIAVDIGVIWALVAHGRDVAMES